MTRSREIVQDDQHLVRYLLGLLPDAEAQRLDEASIVDDDVAFRLRNVEEDLIDAYVAGTLDWDTRQQFESVYLTSHLRREKVLFAERFLSAVDRAASSQRAHPAPAVPPAARVGRFALRSWFSWPLAAAALLTLTFGTLLLEEVRLRERLSGAERGRVALTDRAQNLQKQLDDQRAANIDTRRELDRIRAAQVPTPAFVLLPQMRTTAPVSTVAVPPGSGVVPFDLRLDADDFSAYHVAVRGP